MAGRAEMRKRMRWVLVGKGRGADVCFCPKCGTNVLFIQDGIIAENGWYFMPAGIGCQTSVRCMGAACGLPVAFRDQRPEGATPCGDILNAYCLLSPPSWSLAAIVHRNNLFHPRLT